MEQQHKYDDVSKSKNPADDIFEDSLDDFPTTSRNGNGDQSSPSPSLASFVPETPGEASSSQSTLRRRLISGRGALSRDRSSWQSQSSPFCEKRRIFRAKSNPISREVEGSPEDISTDSNTAVPTEESVSHNSPLEVNDSFLEMVAGFLLKAIAFQFTIFIKLLLSPFWIVFKLYKLAIDPLGFVWRLRESLLRKVTTTVKWGMKKISPVMETWLKEHEININLALRVGWGLLWAIYIGTVLSALLASSFILTKLLIGFVVEKPLHIQTKLNFDYSESKPLAHVPVIPGKGFHCDSKNGGESHLHDTQIYLSKRKIALTIALTLPESEYNRRLGNFQVRVEFLSRNGEVLAVLIQNGILKFKSQIVRALTTFLKIVPIITGYVSESQTIVLKARNLRPENGEVSCIRVALEQRAELLPSSGIPEIYEGFISIDSELPFLKKMMWNWRRSVFVWISLVSFFMQLLFVVMTCRKLIMPASRNREPLDVARS